MNYGKKNARKKQKQLTSKKIKAGRKFAVIFRKTLLICILAVVIIGAFAGYGVIRGVIDAAPDIEDIDATPTGYLSTVLDDGGNQIATLVASGSNRVYATLDEIPVDMQHAFVAIEDSRFYEHNGIDLRGIARALVLGLKSGLEETQGASTITQQLLKNNVFTDWTSESSLSDKLKRKIQEQYLAVQLEKVQSKEWILENYLNTINLGQNCLGVQAAAKRYFGKDVSELNLSESAVIAAITQNPSRYNPISAPEENSKRRETVLTYMLEQEYISEKEYNDALADDVYSRIQIVNAQTEETKNVYSYFVDELTDQVIDDLIEIKGYTESQAYKALYNGGLTIYSTQNAAIQGICDEEVANPENYDADTRYSFSYALTIERADGTYENFDENTMLSYYQSSDPSYEINFSSREEAQAAVDQYKAEIMKPEDKIVANGEALTFTIQPQASLTIMDQTTGEVKALVGGRGEKTASKTLNRATRTTRQPGSTFKVLAAFAPALDSAGMTLATVQDDAPYSYANGVTVNNYDNSYRGFTTIREAITHSINIVTVKTLTDITPQVGYDYLLNFGFTTLTDTDIVQSLALGGITNGVTNLELTAAYATIANKGTYTKPRFYTKILDHEGDVLIDNTPQTHTVLKESTAYLLTDAMGDVMTSGTGTSANFDGMPTAGKSGTTTKNRDALFAGFTPYYTCVVWGGYDDNTPLTSTSYPKTLWKGVMSRIHENLEPKDFEKPADIVSATICKKSGNRVVEGLCDNDPRGSMARTELFAEGTVPVEGCDHHVSVTLCSASGLLAGEFCPPEFHYTGVYITGGSPGSADGSYLIGVSETCNVHTALPIPVPEVPIGNDESIRQDITGIANPNDPGNDSPDNNSPESGDTVKPEESSDNKPEENPPGDNNGDTGSPPD